MRFYENRTVAQDVKLEDERIKYRKKCSCGHTMVVLPTLKKDYVVCSWCKKKVFKDDEKQKEHDRKVERENFRMKMWGML